MRMALSRVEQSLALVAQSQRDTDRQLQSLELRRERLAQELEGVQAPELELLAQLAGDKAAAEELLEESHAVLAGLEEKLPDADERRSQALEAARVQADALARLGVPVRFPPEGGADWFGEGEGGGLAAPSPGGLLDGEGGSGGDASGNGSSSHSYGHGSWGHNSNNGTNNGATITLVTGSMITVFGNMVIHSGGKVNNDGTLDLKGNLVNEN